MGYNSEPPSPALLPFTAGHPRLCPLIMAGDPDLDTTRALLTRCVDLGVRMVELCVPFRNAFTDGDTLRRAHKRALKNEVSPSETVFAVLDMVRAFHKQIDIVLLVDSSHTLRPVGMDLLLGRAKEAGVSALLPHGLPPRLVEQFNTAARRAGMPVVGTIYANATPEVRQKVLHQTSAFLYLVSTYGRSGGAVDPCDLTPRIEMLRTQTDVPIALGFGLRSPQDVARAFAAGCDIAIVGSAISNEVDAALDAGECVVDRAGSFIAALQAAAQPTRQESTA
ncbi:tryptophan synthase subunit alpha (plasmid) [Aliiroseovarius crassostreae]|uniref:tryptophan synthase n=1 Tax=Aliiroseovarius crassostreae TaxID=154981 RepID=A0A9Q9HHT7_9RHOB|nr:tryptophan synthase subunit alpha [Aliiroseovarius crassostreae]UWP97210.1 tryptophan synthase subunit alpha [Aliiroseovarius crassostreae]